MTPSAADPTPGTRERLLDAAERLFAERGFAGTSVREITDAAGANLGAVNYHFRSKENLYAEVFARRVALLRDPVLAAARESREPRPQEARTRRSAPSAAPSWPHTRTATPRWRLLGLFARETIEASLPPGLLVRELLVPTIEAIAGRRAAGAARPARSRGPGLCPLVLRAAHAHREGGRASTSRPWTSSSSTPCASRWRPSGTSRGRVPQRTARKTQRRPS